MSHAHARGPISRGGPPARGPPASRPRRLAPARRGRPRVARAALPAGCRAVCPLCSPAAVLERAARHGEAAGEGLDLPEHGLHLLALVHELLELHELLGLHALLNFQAKHDALVQELAHLDEVSLLVATRRQRTGAEA